MKNKVISVKMTAILAEVVILFAGKSEVPYLTTIDNTSK